MDIVKVKKQLKKINVLFATIEEEGSITAIEKDLLKSYVQTLYARLLEEEESTDQKVPSQPDRKVSTHTSQKEVSQAHTHDSTTEVVKGIDQKEASIFDEIEEVIDHSVGDEASAIAIEDQVVNGKENRMTSLATDTMLEETPQVSEVKEIDVAEQPQEYFPELFDESESNELSSRLSKTPISDLNGAMGLNEKIQIINELFDGEKEHFAKVIESLNGFSSLEEAQKFLSREVIYRYDWTSEGKVNNAKAFIKMVRRRYL